MKRTSKAAATVHHQTQPGRDATPCRQQGPCRICALVLLVASAAAAPADTGMTAHFASPRWRQGPGTKVAGTLAAAIDALGKRALPPAEFPFVRVDKSGRVQVRIRLERLDAAALIELRNAGLEVEIANERLKVVRGWAPPGAVWGLASMRNVQRITPPDYVFTRTGTVEGEHDHILGCDEVRATFGVTARGVRVGVISDGVDHVAASQATGNAPVVTIPSDPRCRRGSGDEGSAIIEIIHDCAPGAEIGFCGPLDDLEMIDCIACLRDAFGAAILVDDLGFANQPFFADGTVAGAVREAVDAGAAYFSAAGNSAQHHYQGTYQRCRGGDRHRFAADDCTMDFRFHGSVGIFLQWDEPFGSARSNYDLCAPGLGCSEDVQDGDDDPVEALTISCATGSCTGGLEIYKRSGVDTEIEVFLLPVGQSNIELLEHRVTSDSIFGHPCVQGIFAVGAIDAAQPQHKMIESFSSRGPCTIKFPAPESRLKPDLTGIDGISNSRPGGFPSPFFGTSASAPGVAAVAALLLELDPSLTLPELRALLENTSVDLGVPGPDITYGYGRVNAPAAANALLGQPILGTRTPTPTSTVRQNPTPTPSASPLLLRCPGDCNRDGSVTVDEIITAVQIMLGTTVLHTCQDADIDGDGSITVDEVVQGVNSALSGCN